MHESTGQSRASDLAQVKENEFSLDRLVTLPSPPPPPPPAPTPNQKGRPSAPFPAHATAAGGLAPAPRPRGRFPPAPHFTCGASSPLA